MPDFPLIDAHVHLYDPAEVPVPWVRGTPGLEQAHGLADYTRRTEGVSVEGMVVVEVDVADGHHLDEARWIERHGDGDARLRGIVASLPLERGARAIEADLAALAALPHARGVRRLLQPHADEPGWALREPFVEGVRALAGHGLPFDLCLRHGQLGDAVELVRRCPTVGFVLDHIGKPPIREPEPEAVELWRTRMGLLADEPNVVCKLSGVATEADPAAWTYDDLAPYLAHAIGCFGFDRLMFGGDWPVSELATSYARWVEVVDRVTAGVPRADLERLYRGTATRVYRLQASTAAGSFRPGLP